MGSMPRLPLLDETRRGALRQDLHGKKARDPEGYQAAQVQKRPSEEDQIAMVLKSLNPEYTNRLTLTHHPTFHSLVCAG